MQAKLIYDKKNDKYLESYPYYPCFFRTTCMLILPLALALVLSKGVYTAPVIKQGTITLLRNETFQAGLHYNWVECLGYEMDNTEMILPCNCNYKTIFSDVKYCSSVYHNGESINYYEFTDGLISYDKDLYEEIMLRRLIVDILFIYVPSAIISVSFIVTLFSKRIHGVLKEITCNNDKKEEEERKEEERNRDELVRV